MTESKRIAPSKADLDVVEEIKAEESEQARILSRSINWQLLADGKLISEQDKSLLLDYDKHTSAEKKDVLDEHKEKYAAVFLKILSNVQDKDIVAYTLTLVSQLLEDDRSRARFFHDLAQPIFSPYNPFISVLTRSSESYTIGKASHILSILLGSDVDVKSAPAGFVAAVEEYMKWLIAYILSIPSATKRVAPLTALKDLLKQSYTQILFSNLGGWRALDKHFNGQEQNAQLQYLSGFCVWLLTFNTDAGVIEELRKFEVVRRLAEVVKASTREKVIRISYAALRNLLKDSAFTEEMIGHGLHKVSATLHSRKWKDADLPKDIEAVIATLQTRINQLSSFEMYQAELQSGSLQWSPVHSENFWAEHKNKFEEKNFDAIARLIALLDKDKVGDELTTEVACYDLGEFARFHNEGRRVINKLGGKVKLMQKMADKKNQKIAKQALLAVQKLMVQNWDALAKSGKQ